MLRQLRRSFKSKDGDSQADNSDETYTFILCAICPVKQTKANLHYVPEEKLFHDGAMNQMVSAPALGFLFPAFDDRATNIYNALYYTHDITASQDGLIEAVFNTPVPQPAAEQKKSFEALLTTSLGMIAVWTWCRPSTTSCASASSCTRRARCRSR